MISIHSVFVGRPERITDEAGVWESSIFRQAVFGPVELGSQGIVGDQVTDRVHHGRPSQAVSVHPIEHYEYWNEQFRLEPRGQQLGPGSVGENWTIEGGNECTVCVGDTYSIGSSEVQVSGPRGPCWKQERRLKLPGFLNDFDGRGTEESSWLLSTIDRALGFLSSTTWIATVTLPGRLRDPLI